MDRTNANFSDSILNVEIIYDGNTSMSVFCFHSCLHIKCWNYLKSKHTHSSPADSSYNTPPASGENLYKVKSCVRHPLVWIMYSRMSSRVQFRYGITAPGITCATMGIWDIENGGAAGWNGWSRKYKKKQAILNTLIPKRSLQQKKCSHRRLIKHPYLGWLSQQGRRSDQIQSTLTDLASDRDKLNSRKISKLVGGGGG